MKTLVNFDRQWVEIPAHLLAEIISCSIYESDGFYKPYTYKPGNVNRIEVIVVSDEALLPPEPVTVNIEEIMEENNRLQRELDKLKEKLESRKSKSTDLEVV